MTRFDGQLNSNQCCSPLARTPVDARVPVITTCRDGGSHRFGGQVKSWQEEKFEGEYVRPAAPHGRRNSGHLSSEHETEGFRARPGIDAETAHDDSTGNVVGIRPDYSVNPDTPCVIRWLPGRSCHNLRPSPRGSVRCSRPSGVRPRVVRVPATHAPRPSRR
jgi:hypothetical protein